MHHLSRLSHTLLLLPLLCPSVALADALLQPGDFVLAVDTDPASSHSRSPDGEGAEGAIDGISTTKYLNLAQPAADLGLVVEPLFGGTVARSIQFTTAGDAPHRDPIGYTLYGTDDTITSANHGSLEGAESWIEIASGALDLPTERLTVAAPINITNSTAYNNYRIEFNAPRGENITNGIQIGDVQIFEQSDASAGAIFGFGDAAIAYQLPQPDSFYFEHESPGHAIDSVHTPTSSYPENENPGSLVDGDTATKYLNFGGVNSGFIATLNTPAQVQSFIVTSANDFLTRHPTSYQLFGTNDPIATEDNGFETPENWTEISSGAIESPGEEAYFTDSPVVSVSNSETYSSYKLLFPTLGTEQESIMQISEASFFASTDGAGEDILEAATADILAIDEDFNTTKFFNTGLENVGLIVTPSVGASVVDGFQLTTANDATHRDPTSWVLYGTNETIVSEDNSQGDAEAWTEIASGDFSDLEVPEDRNTIGEAVAIANEAQYTSYKIVFPTIRDATQEDGFQIADIQMFGAILDPPGDPGDFNGDGVVDAADYTVWRDGLDTTYTQADYDVWKANYGTDYNSLTAATAAPAPAASILALGAMLLSGVVRRR